MLTAPNPSPLSLFKLKKMILSLTSMGKYEFSDEEFQKPILVYMYS